MVSGRGESCRRNPAPDQSRRADWSMRLGAIRRQRHQFLIDGNDRIVDRMLRQIRLYQWPALSVHRHADRDESSILILLLELHIPRNLNRAPRAPRRPEVKQDHLANIRRQPDRRIVGIDEGEIGRGLSRRHCCVIGKHASTRVSRSGTRESAQSHPSREAERQTLARGDR
jgi:hypothetical protein